jgi:2-polyprenyl-6-methoxyphenol hydroxylase-like FAD-dependent oxidoreductase
VTLLGDAAHPMYPRGANGAAQAILDCRTLADCLKNERDPQVALAQYERARLPATAKVVLTNRQNPPDAILREVFVRTGDRPFRSIGDVISREELAGMSESYHRISGSDKESVHGAR